MKVCVCSDSHGNRDGLKRMLELEKPDALLFCGDGIDDFKGLELPERTLFVKGNCDFMCDEPIMREFVLEGVKIIMTHGHKYSVKTTTDIYLSEAFARDANVALYGHTHFQQASYNNGVLLLNGGTMSKNSGYYAILELENGKYDCQLKRLLPTVSRF